MNIHQPIYTENNNCQDCYKCVRHCPVKAIRIADNCASVIDEYCIACGRCVEVCPVGAKRVRCDLDVAKLLIKGGRKVILSLAPSWVSCFPGVQAQAMIAGLKQLGFFVISETALGAEMVNRVTRAELVSAAPGITISSACPSIVELIRRHHPELHNLVSPLTSPLLAHAQYLKRYYGEEVHVVFAGPCIAKKRESDAYRHWVDAAITFQELESWLEDEWINLQTPVDAEEHFEPVEAVLGTRYPIDGGMIAGIKQGQSTEHIQFMAFSGLESAREVLTDLQKWKPTQAVFIEMLACAGGCINGPGCQKQGSMAMRHAEVMSSLSVKNRAIGKGKELVFPMNLNLDPLQPAITTRRTSYSAEDIMESLRAVGKQTPKDELNCGGCGYERCHEFAIAMLNGLAERNMCVSYMRRVAHDKASVLLQRMPSGVMIVDEHLRVIECNFNMARMLGTETQMIFEANPGLSGADVVKLTPFHKMFDAVMASGKDILDREVRINGNFLKVSVFTVQAHKIVCAIVRDLYNPEVRNDEIVKRTRSIIKENLATVQKIAYLLGENASRTETTLNSILEILKDDQHDEEEDFSC